MPFISPVIPGYSTLVYLIQKIRSDHLNTHGPMHALVRQEFPNESDVPPLVGLMSLYKPIIFINSPEYLEDFYVKQAKYVDKEDMLRIQLFSLLGNSSIMMSSTEAQARKRKTISSAFYKDKLYKMVEQMKEVVAEKIEEMQHKFINDKEGQLVGFDLLEQLNQIHIRVILNTAFGEDLKNQTLPYVLNGAVTQKGLGQYLRDIFMYIIFKSARYELMIIPALTFLFYKKSDREYLKNAKVARDFCRQLIQERRKNLDQHKERADLLTILLLDEEYSKNEEEIIDECITFFLAGSQTVIAANANLIQYATMNPEIQNKLLQEFRHVILPDLNQEQLLNIDIRKEFNYDKIQDLNYFMMCFNESMRIEPPVSFSSMLLLTQDTTLNFPSTNKQTQARWTFNIKKGDNIIINIPQIHHDPNQWIDHDKYIPERFDHQSKYYLKPNGQKRHSLAFTPFLGGRRICIGKTFAEIVAKIVVPALMCRFKFEFVDKERYQNKLPLNVDMVVQPKIMIRIKPQDFQNL
eukprot:403335549